MKPWPLVSTSLRVHAVTAPPATTLRVGRSLKSSSLATRPDGCAFGDSPESVNNPYSACSVLVHGLAWFSVECERNGMVRVGTKAPHFEIEVASIESVAERRRRLRRASIAEHALVPSFAGCRLPGRRRRHAQPRPGWMGQKCFRVIWSPWAQRCASRARIGKPLGLEGPAEANHQRTDCHRIVAPPF